MFEEQTKQNDKEMERRLRQDAGAWRTVPAPELRVRVMRAIADDRLEGWQAAGKASRSRRLVAVLAACVVVFVTGVVAVRLQQPLRPPGDLERARERIEALQASLAGKTQRAEELLLASSLRREVQAIVSDASSLARIAGLGSGASELQDQ